MCSDRREKSTPGLLATKMRRRWALDSCYYCQGRVIDLDAEGSRLILRDLDPFFRRDWSIDGPGKRLFFVPDPRLSRYRSDLEENDADEPVSEDFAYALEYDKYFLYSKRVKRFPVFGSVKSVRWNYWTDMGGPVEWLLKRVADDLKESSLLETAIKEANIDLRIMFPGIWVIFSPRTATLKSTVRECLQTVAEVLLEIPIPPDDQDALA